MSFENETLPAFDPRDEDDPFRGLANQAVDPALYTNQVTIYDALHNVMQEVGIVGKDGKNDFQKYSYTSEAAAIAALRPAFIRHGILALPSFEFAGLSDPNGNTFVTGVVKFFHVPSRTSFEASFLGAGNDRNSKGVGDKAVYKAMTGLLKNAFFHTFMLERRDDPEAPNEFDTFGLAAQIQTKEGPGTQRAYSAYSREVQEEAAYPVGRIHIDSSIADVHKDIANTGSLQDLEQVWVRNNSLMAQIYSANPEAYRVLDEKFRQKAASFQQQQTTA